MRNHCTKHPSGSRTLWINALAAATAELLTHLPTLQGTLPANYYAWAFYALVAANVVLRLLTTQPLRLRPRREGEHE